MISYEKIEDTNCKDYFDKIIFILMNLINSKIINSFFLRNLHIVKNYYKTKSKNVFLKKICFLDNKY